jgi:ABC-type nitrate/sulfonate/bicarbonate transport system permease component
VRRALGSLVGLALPFVVVALLWQGFAVWGPMPPKLFPRVETIAAAFARLVGNGILPLHAAHTLVRLAVAFGIGSALGLALGLVMGRSRWAEDLLLPLVSIGNPIPGLAYAPLFVIWFGLGDLPAVLLVGFAAAFPVAVNTWTGVKAVKQIWIRAAQAMGAPERELFRKVVLPGALPWVLTGLRLGLARAWRVLVAVEMLTSVRIGLGWLIFGSREFLATDVMLASIAVIGLVGLGLEKLVFERIERFTIMRWGMVARWARVSSRRSRARRARSSGRSARPRAYPARSWAGCSPPAPPSSSGRPSRGAGSSPPPSRRRSSTSPPRWAG